jgi:Helix-turn-helix domain
MRWRFHDSAAYALSIHRQNGCAAAAVGSGLMRRADTGAGGRDGQCRIDGATTEGTLVGAQSCSLRISAIERANEMTRGPRGRTGRESSRQGWPELLALGDARRKRTSAAREASAPSYDDALPEAVHDLLTDAQLAARWQLSRGTLANQRSQGRGPAYLKLAGRVRYRRSDIEAYEARLIRS